MKTETARIFLTHPTDDNQIEDKDQQVQDPNELHHVTS